jgi:hypothetical protein
MKKIQIVFAASIIIFALACKKENKNSNMDLITNGHWKISALTANPGFDYDGDGTIDTDIFALYDPCEKDDYYDFHKDGTLDINQGASKCDPSAEQWFTVYWEFADNEKSIILNGEKATIEELSSSRLTLQVVEYGHNLTISFVKQ